MINEKYILFNMTLEEYNKKYRNRRHRLLKHTKKDVENFDNKYKTHNFLLKDRVWYLIGDTYYEKPIAPRFTWFRNLSATAQAITCVLAGGAVATAAVVPAVLLNNGGSINPEEDGKIVIDSTDVNFTGGKQQDGSFVAKITPKIGEDKGVVENIEINIGTYKLKENEYKFNEFKGDLVISKEVMSSHKGKITIKPIVKELPVSTDYIVYTQIPSTNTCKIRVKNDATSKSKVPSIFKIPTVDPNNPNLSVVEIEESGFSNLSIKKLLITKQIKKIGDAAFQSSSANLGTIESIEFEEDSECGEIGGAAFYNQIYKELTIPKNVTSIGNSAFSVNYSNDFYGSMTSLKFESNSKLSKLGEGVFRRQKLSGEIVLPKTLTDLGAFLFYECNNINGYTVRFEEGTTISKLPKSTFGKSTLKDIVLPASITELCDGVFEKCSQLTNADLSAITNLTIGAKVFTESCPKILDISKCSNIVQTRTDLDCAYWLDGDFEEMKFPSKFIKINAKGIRSSKLKILDFSLYDGGVTDIQGYNEFDGSKLEHIYVNNATIANNFKNHSNWKSKVGETKLAEIVSVKSSN